MAFVGLGPASANTRTLGTVACLTQKLNVSLGVAAALGEWDDVVEFQALLATALDTTSAVALPNEHPNVLWNRFARRGSNSFEILERFDLASQFVQRFFLAQDSMLDSKRQFFGV
jgi:hypothetical protein